MWEKVKKKHEIQLFYCIFSKKKLVFVHFFIQNWLKVELRLVFSTFQPFHSLLSSLPEVCLPQSGPVRICQHGCTFQRPSPTGDPWCCASPCLTELPSYRGWLFRFFLTCATKPTHTLGVSHHRACCVPTVVCRYATQPVCAVYNTTFFRSPWVFCQISFSSAQLLNLDDL